MGSQKLRRGGESSSCGPSGCPIGAYPIHGGTKHRRQRRHKTHKKRRNRKGGSFYQPAPPLPPPFVGAPWTANPNTWPGYGESNNHGNHYSQNMYHQDPKMMIQYTGGKRRKTRRHRRRGGASLLQTAVNGYRDLAYNFDSAYRALRGYEPPVNPLPYKDQFVRRV